MAKGYRVKGTWVEDVISDTYLKHRNWENKEIHSEVRERVRERIREIVSEPDTKLSSVERERLSKLLKSNWPGLSVVEHALSGYRKKDNKIAKEGLEEPWSMATLGRFPLPAESLPAVLAVWKFSLAHGYSFSNRTAKWVARLHTVIADTQKLYLRAWLYALREHSYALREKDPYTGDLDASMISGLWELLTMELTGPVHFERREFLANPLALKLEGYTGLDAVKIEEDSLRPDLCDIAKQKTGPLPPMTSLNLSEDALFVYARWLRHISKGPKWQNLSEKEGLSEKERLEVILELRKWIAEHPWAKEAPPWACVVTKEGRRIVDDIRFKVPVKPTNLLKKVGYKEE